MNERYIVIDDYYGTTAMQPTTSRQQARAFAQRMTEQTGRLFIVEPIYD